MSHQKIPLGSEVQCVITGVKGTAISMVERLNGNVQYGVQPRSEDGRSYPEAWEIDQQSLEITGPGISERATPAVQTQLKLGMKVRDWVSGFSGVATSKHTYLNGCVNFWVVPPMENTKALLNEAPQGSYLSVERLRAVEEAAQVMPADYKPAEKPTGGPAGRIAAAVGMAARRAIRA